MLQQEAAAKTHHRLVCPRSRKWDFLTLIQPAELSFAQTWEMFYDGAKHPGNSWAEKGTGDQDVVPDIGAAVRVAGASQTSSLLSQRETGTLVTQKGHQRKVTELVSSLACGTRSHASYLNETQPVTGKKLKDREKKKKAAVEATE